MKKLYILILLIISVTTLFAQPKLIKIVHQYRATNSPWNNSSEDNFTYNNKGLLETFGFNLIIRSDTTPSTVDSNYYNSNGQLDSTKSFKWDADSSTWEYPDVKLVKYTYNGSRLEMIFHSNKVNDFASVDSFIYNSMGKIEYRYHFLKHNNGTNSSYGRDKNTYNTAGNIVEKLSQTFKGGNWVNGPRRTYTYNSSGDLIEELEERYNSSTTSWVINSKIENAYNAGEKTYRLEKTYQSGKWFVRDSITYEYNLDGTLREANFTLNARSLYFYKNSTTRLAKITNNEFKVYPNPTNGKFTIELGNTEPSAITITDVTGKQVYTTKASGDLDIDLTNLQKGIYLVNIKGRAGSSTQKIVVQ